MAQEISDPDGRYLAAASRTILIWQFDTQHTRKILRGHTDTIHALNFSPDGRRIVSASCDNTVRIWNLRDGSSTVVGDQQGSYWTACFSPDGQYVAASSRYAIKLWDARTGRVLRDLVGHQSHIGSLTFTPNGEALLSGSNDTTLKYWDTSSLREILLDSRQQGRHATRIDSGKLGEGQHRLRGEVKVLQTFEGHGGGVNSVSTSPYGQWLLSGSDDGTACIWDAHKVMLHCTLEYGCRILSVAFSPVGNLFFIVDDKGRLSLWDYARI